MKEQKISPDDPKLTAYALGELSGAERTEVETALTGDPAARAAVDEIRALAAQLEGALADEPEMVVPLTIPGASPKAVNGEAARDSAKTHARENDPYSRKVARFPYVWIGTLAAACFAVVFALRTEKPDLLAKHAGEKPTQTKANNATAMTPAEVLAEKNTGPRSVPTLVKNETEIRSPAQAKGAKSGSTVLLVKDAEEFAGIPAPEKTVEKPGTTSSSGDEILVKTLFAIAPTPAVPESQANASTPALPEPVTIASAPLSGPVVAPSISGEGLAWANTPAANSPAASANDEVVMLSAFEVKESVDRGYLGASTLRTSRVTFSDKRNSGGNTKNESREDAGSVTSYGFSGPLFMAPRMNFRAKNTAPLFNTESYAFVPENDFFRVRSSPLSTFSIDVDTASYANVRRFLEQGVRPPRDAVRVEEMVNYFNYRYAPPEKEAGEPFAASMEIAAAPWNPAHRLVRIGLKGREVATSERPAANLVFLLDVSGSMSDENKLPLVKESLRLLVEKLRADDRVAIVTYAGASGLALPSTSAAKKNDILGALDELRPGGSTNGAMGIQLAYDIAKANFIVGGANRVILCTDGDFNVGVTGDGDLTRLIEEKAKSGVFLTVLGFGMGNYKDGMLERLADKGNGNYGYIDSRAEAQKLLVEQAGGTLVTIAKDVKLQVEFNPSVAQAYRLIGYENRVLKKEDFNNDKVDAGEIGAGHTVTALYEIVPVGAPSPQVAPEVEPLKYQSTASTETAAADDDIKPLKPRLNPEELLTLKIRFKEPTVDVSRKMEIPAIDLGAAFEAASKDFKFAAAVASLGMMLRESAHLGTADYDRVISWAEAGKGDDTDGRRGEFIELAKKARALSAE
jgi:secreted protein with Ig-like and vWFA domain